VDDALFHEHARDTVQPVLEVARAEVVRGVHALDPVAELVNVVAAWGEHGALDGDDHGLPAPVKWRLVLLALHRAEAVHPAEIVDAVHWSSADRILRLFFPIGSRSRLTWGPRH